MMFSAISDANRSHEKLNWTAFSKVLMFIKTAALKKEIKVTKN